MKKNWKIGVIGAQTSGKTTFFHQLYHAIPKESSLAGSIFLNSHQTFERVPADEFVPASHDTSALLIEGTFNVAGKPLGLEVIDTIGGHLTELSTLDTHKDLLETTNELDMLILAIAPDSITGSEKIAMRAMQEHITNLCKIEGGIKRIALAYMKCDEYALPDRPVRILESQEQIRLLNDWINTSKKFLDKPEHIDAAWNKFVKAAAGESSTVKKILNESQFLWRVILAAHNMSAENFNAYLVQSHPADPPVPIQSFSIRKRGVIEIFEDFIEHVKNHESSQTLNWWMIIGGWTFCWLILSAIVKFYA